jgi:hypothetical protein
MGMSRAEVESVLGGPPGSYVALPGVINGTVDPGRITWFPPETAKLWTANGDGIYVSFDDGGRVDDKWWCGRRIAEPLWVDKCILRVKEAWQRWFP